MNITFGAYDSAGAEFALIVLTLKRVYIYCSSPQNSLNAQDPFFPTCHSQHMDPSSSRLEPKLALLVLCVHGEALQSIFASARRREGVKLFARRTLGDTIFVLRPESFFRATMTGADDLVTK